MLALLLQAATVPTLADIDRLPPVEAGNMVLQGKDHGPIEAVVDRGPQPLTPPGFVDRDLIERPVQVDGGCSRKRWQATFRSPTLQRQAPYHLYRSYALTEVALPDRSGKCPGSDYVHLNPGVEVAKGLAALRVAERVRTGRIRVRFDCADRTDDGTFCRSRTSILRHLAAQKPWIMSPATGGFTLSLRGEGPGIVMMQFEEKVPNRVTLIREYPAPA